MDGHHAKDDGKGHRLTLTQKLMMCAQLTGMEAILNFQQIYTVPVKENDDIEEEENDDDSNNIQTITWTKMIMTMMMLLIMEALQTLGVPLSLSYTPGLVSTPSSLLLLPLLGWLTDRGRNPQRRKFACILLAAGVQTLGMLCLLLANAMHLRDLRNYNGTIRRETGPGGPSTESVLSDTVGNLSVSECGEKTNGSGQDWNGYVFADPEGTSSSANGSVDVVDTDIPTVPVKAGLAMLSFILLDLGFDFSNSFIKALMVTCTARAEHTSLMMTAVVTGSVGGVVNSALGAVDLPSLMGLRSWEGAQLTLQTSVQGVVLVLLVILGLLSTLTACRKQLRQLQENQRGTSSMKPQETMTPLEENGSTSNNDDMASAPSDTSKISSVKDAFENSIRSLGESRLPLRSVEETPSSSAEDHPLLEDDVVDEEGGGGGYHVTSSLSAGYGAVKPSAQSHGGGASVEKAPVRGAGGLGSGGGEAGRQSCLQKPKVRIALVCLTTGFAAACCSMYTFGMSDFVGKGVYGGDPKAELGSDSLSRYEKGVEMASLALVVCFVTYLVTSILHPRILACLGFRVEFLLLQLLMVIAMMTVALTFRLEAVMVMGVVVGTFRTCLFSMPYAVTNDIAQSIAYEGSGRNPVGLALSLVAASLPLSHCALFTWVGAVEELTGDVSTLLWLGSGFGIAGAVSFLFVGKV
ncbi:uncharacterized protein LOC143290000 isoform X2 [Babylonia areolata]|uniref:uncharacterized protein LOC143290000 isoform X2 n=1 Tax=Babylonia areolata TaxID=304850 RepID=UPI003FD0966F